MKHDILKNVDILDLINISVEKGQLQNLGKLNVNITPIDNTKQFFIDEKVKKTLEEEVCKRSGGLPISDTKTLIFVEEFVAKMISELYRHDLCGLENIPEPNEDPYKDLRKIN